MLAKHLEDKRNYLSIFNVIKFNFRQQSDFFSSLDLLLNKSFCLATDSCVCLSWTASSYFKILGLNFHIRK